MKLVQDKNDLSRVAGAVGFSVREHKVFVYKFKACLLACGGAVNVFRPRSVGEGQGCSVYEDRPTACRYYALGNMGLHKKDSTSVEDIYFLVKEEHCLGHNEPRTITIRDYRKEQGVEKYDEMNREWRNLVLKKRSAGPTVGAPSSRSMQLFDMCSYDMDSFREFIQTEGFRSMFDIEDTQLGNLIKDDDARLLFALRFLRQILFGEHSIPFKQGARECRIAERKTEWEKRRKNEIERFRERDSQYEDDSGSS